MDQKTVLVVEDNALNMKLVKSLLSLSNFRCLEAGDAEKGIALASQEDPDLILMDIQLPGMDGLTATEKILGDDRLKEIPVIALTSYAMEGDKEKALNAGCKGYITKPLNTRTFIPTISEILNNHTAGPPNIEAVYRKKILIVDDEPLNLKLMYTVLSKTDYQVITANNGEEALEKVEKEAPDIILLDVMMPGLNGYEVTKKLKSNSRYTKIPIVLVTALDGEKEKAKGLEAGADEFINKPINITELNARVKSLLRMKEYGEQLLSRTETAERFFQPGDTLDDSAAKDFYPSILIVDDEQKEIKLLKTYLDDKESYFMTARSGAEVLSNENLSNVDLIILDILLPDTDGYELCKTLKANEKTRNIQILMLTSLQDLNSRIRGFDYGADDFLTKPASPEELRARAGALLRKKVYLDSLTKRHDFAVQSAITDALTGLYNQSYFKHYLENELNKTKRKPYPISLLMLDIDNFKALNDRYGHTSGDKILQHVGKVLKTNIREIDLAVRYGGDEFSIVMPWTNKDEAFKAANRIIDEFKKNPIDLGNNGNTENITISIGVASGENRTVDEMIDNADRALYQAKGEGKNRACAAS
jgi:two-component system cell cycle response regulator